MQTEQFQWFQAAQVGDLQFIRDHKKEFLGSKNSMGQTALMFATEYQHEAVVIELIEEAGQVSLLQEAAIFNAIKHHNLMLLQLLLPHESQLLSEQNKTPAMCCVDEDWAEGARLLALDTRKDEFSGLTPLIESIDRRRMELVRVLASA